MPLLREPRDYFFGTLSAAAAVSDTSLSADVFSQLDGGKYSTSLVLPLVLHDPSLGFHEIVWVTRHDAGSSTVTVQRGKEETSALAWPSGTQVICSPTAARDMLGSYPTTGLPSDPHVGQRVVPPDYPVACEYTPLGGWQPSVGVAFGQDTADTDVPLNANMLLRGVWFVQAADSAGQWHVTFKRPFPNGCVGVVITPMGTYWQPVSVWSMSKTGFVAQGWSASNPGTKLGSGWQMGAYYLAMGW